MPSGADLVADAGVLDREAGLAHAGERWGRLAYAAALAFVAVLYANPMNWFPQLERLRLGLLTAAACALAVAMRRLTGGQRIRAGGLAGVLLFGYAASGFLSITWTIVPWATRAWMVEVAKLLVVWVAIQNALDTATRLRRFALVAAVASLAPAVGGVRTWLAGDNLVEGIRTHWVNLFADPNRLAMGLVAVLPLAMASFARARRPWLKALLAFTVAAQVASIVLTHSRSGAVAMAVAVLLYLFRGGSGALKGVVVALALLVGVAALAPRTFWERSATIADYREDASVAGREHAWQVLGSIVEQRPLSGVGAGGFYFSWDRYAPLSAGGQHLVAHNILMEVLGELGAIALLLFAGFFAALLLPLWRAGRDALVGREARALFAGLAGYLLMEMINGSTLSWFLYFLLAAATAAVRLARLHRALEVEEAR